MSSLSARRAWIEMMKGTICALKRCEVALRKESVDRNITSILLKFGKLKSLSARRAWIEMYIFFKLKIMYRVALRKESVDRNRR